MSVQLLEPRSSEVRLGIQGSSDEILTRLKASDSLFLASPQPAQGTLFYYGASGQITVVAGQITVVGNESDRRMAVEAVYEMVGRPTNEAVFVVS